MSELANPHDRQFNNADSFAQAFDAAWHLHEQQHPHHDLDRDRKRALVLQSLIDHPFQRSHPKLAAQVASFRLRLLGL